jgi:hypothetical protein
MSDLDAGEKARIVEATLLILLSWLAWFVFGYAIGLATGSR